MHHLEALNIINLAHGHQPTNLKLGTFLDYKLNEIRELVFLYTEFSILTRREHLYQDGLLTRDFATFFIQFLC